MRRREVLKRLPALALGAAVAPTSLFAQAGRRIPLGIQYGGPGATPEANKMKMEGFKQLGYDLIEPVNMSGFDPTLFRKQADEVGLGLYSIHITTANTASRGEGAGPAGAGGRQGGERGGQPGAGGGQPGAPGGGGRGGGAPTGVYAKNGRPLHGQVVIGQDTTYNNEGIINIVKAQA